VIGFALSWPRQEDGVLCISGQGRDAIEEEFATAPDEVRQSLRWLPIGTGVELAA